MSFTRYGRLPLILAGAFAATTALAAEGVPEWNYEDGPNGPENWGDLYELWEACRDGLAQSPIDIDNAEDEDVSELKLYWDRNAEWELLNNGHTIEMEPHHGAGYAELAGKRFELLQFHFHTPSEHAIDGDRFEMEAHFVHRADDGLLAVLGVMIEPKRGGGSGTDLFSEIMEQAPIEEGEVEFGHADPSDLLPPPNRGSDFYRYEGSLTTPPCSEIVTWTVLEKPIRVSREAIENFQAIYEMNARPLQDLNDREIYERDGRRRHRRGDDD